MLYTVNTVRSIYRDRHYFSSPLVSMCSSHVVNQGSPLLVWVSHEFNKILGTLV